MNTFRLGDVLEVQSGFAFKKEYFSESDGVPLIRIRDLDNFSTEINYLGEYRNEFIVETGAYLIGMDGSFQCHRWRGGRALLNQRVSRLRNFKEVVEPEYVYYGIQKKLTEIENTTSFVTVKHISAKQIQNIELPLPTIAEQRRIVDILSRAEGIVRLRRDAEKKAAELIPALFFDMFGDPATNPKSLPTKKINDICDLVRGSSPRPQGDSRFFGGPVPRLMIADVTRDGVYVIPRIDSLTIEGAKKSRPMKAGEVVMAVSGAVGLPAILAIDACIHDGFVGFRSLSGEVSPEYFYNFLAAYRHLSVGQAVGATFQNLKTDQIREWLVPLPSQTEQAHFNRVAADIRSLEIQQSAATAKAQAAFDALLAQVFQG